jgi:peptidoglycan/LPS O-acetylase OafA/YrhL
LGAIAVEAAFGLVKLPKWCRSLWIGAAAIVVASATSTILPTTQKDTLPHNLAWMLMHPAWGIGFFILVNRAVEAEQMWVGKVKVAGAFARLSLRLVAAAAFVGAFSYSLYLTHELVIMQSWWFVIQGFPQILNALLIVIPATVLFAWVFYRFCEKPYMRKQSPVPSPESPVAIAQSPVASPQSPIASPHSPVVESVEYVLPTV